MCLRNWPVTSIFVQTPSAVEVDGGLLWADWAQASACRDRVIANGLTCMLWTYPGTAGVFAEISGAYPQEAMS